MLVSLWVLDMCKFSTIYKDTKFTKLKEFLKNNNKTNKKKLFKIQSFGDARCPSDNNIMLTQKKKKWSGHDFVRL